MNTNPKEIAIEKLKWERECHMRYIERLVKTIKTKNNSSKDFLIKAAGKILKAGIQIKRFEIELYRIITTPVPRFKPGAVMPKGPAIVGDSGKPEIILTPNHLQP